ncbi:MAG: 1,4-alpha-glucan branching protein GlgB [Proteobacteria bacterium]|nr:1,4-alpha-glucan branching protein GlgB [Pseudomonadota bacterium]
MARTPKRAEWIGAGEAEALRTADHGDPFGVLGLHEAGGRLVLRALVPGAETLAVLDRDGGRIVAEIPRVHQDGLFAGPLPEGTARFAYVLRAANAGGEWTFEDPYRFGPVLGEMDEYLLAEGTHLRLDERMGAHPCEHEGVAGTVFTVWAPNARRVSVVGDFNDWDGRRGMMRRRGATGVWEIFLPGVGEGARYKYEIKAQDGTLLPLKADPVGFFAEMRPGTASVVCGIGGWTWNDGDWMARRRGAQFVDAPMSIYEVHLGSWRRDGDRWLTYRELADTLVPYVRDMGFTHVELLPVSEHPFDGSWGYQPIGMFAPTSRFGGPADFKALIEAFHAAGIGVILDWVPGHFPTDAHGLGQFDGTHLYEHADPRQGFHLDWNTLIYNFGRREVSNYLIANALYWCRQFHIDGLRVDAVASMLYLDYSRPEGQWVPNKYGGNENLDAIAFLKQMNQVVYGAIDGVMTVAEESTSWPGVSRPTDQGGLGFGYKWNMGWMNDTLAYMAREPVHRRYHHNQMTFALMYAFSENFVLPISHDEVVHGKRSLVNKMPGDTWHKFANLRAYLGFMWCHPGKKLLFMGCEFAQWTEWNHAVQLDWPALGSPRHAGVQSLVRDLNAAYRANPALYRRDTEGGGFAWLEVNAADESILAFARFGAGGEPAVAALCNFTPVPRTARRIGLPAPGRWEEIVNTDAAEYGGSGLGNGGAVIAEPIPCGGHAWSAACVLPPLATVILRHAG